MRNISGRQFVTFAICDLYDTPDPDVKKNKIMVYLEKQRKVESPFVYGYFGLVSTVQILSNDIGMKFGIKKCDVRVLKRGKVVSSEGAEMPDGERIKVVQKNGYKYLGILEYNKIRESKMQENFREEYLRRTKLIMKSRLSGKE